MPGNSWYYLCVATWWPMDEEKCSTEARCSVCTTSVMAAYSACEKFGIVNHECLQKVNITQSMNNMGINRNELRSMGSIFQAITNFRANVNNQQEV